MKDDYDGAEPSGNSVATDVLLRLAKLTGDDNLALRAKRSLEAFAKKLEAQPTMAPQMLAALGRWLSVPAQVIFRCQKVDEEIEARLSREWARFSPTTLVMAMSDDVAQALSGVAPFFGGLERRGRLTIYRCVNFACELPEVID